MIPSYHEGFLIRKDKNILILNSDNVELSRDYMVQNDLKILEVNPNHFNGTTINFLDNFSFIQGLIILTPRITDISPIQKLDNLKTLNLQHKLGGELDFAKFKLLEDCSFSWGIQGSDTIHNADHLLKLRIDNYALPDLTKFSRGVKIKELSLYNANIVSLSGIELFTELISLDLTGCNKLVRVYDIQYLERLINLRIDLCNKISDIEYIGLLRRLKKISFNNIGDVQSIKWMKDLRQLEEIIFTDNTNIQDGDLSILQELHQKAHLKKILFRNRKHYSHSVEDLGYKKPKAVSDLFAKRK